MPLVAAIVICLIAYAIIRLSCGPGNPWKRYPRDAVEREDAIYGGDLDV